MHVRISNDEHADRRWRIHEITPDFRIEDVWALPTPGGPGDFSLLIDCLATGDPEGGPSAPARALWALRWKLGEIFGWDDHEGLPTLRDRLPADLRQTAAGPTPKLPFTPLYLLEDEWAAEIANKTMHGVMHVSWVRADEGGYRGQMAVLVKPNGVRGRLYMAAIRPFRYLVVYPAFMRQIEREWKRRLRAAGGASSQTPPAAAHAAGH